MNRVDKIQKFDATFGLSMLPGANAAGGVRLDWSLLPSMVATHVRHMKLFSTLLAIPLGPGLAKADFVWKRDPESLSVWAFVGAGPKQARERLLQLATTTMTSEIPYIAGPAGLGELALQGWTTPSTTVAWVFRNVCVQVGNAGTNVPLEPIARAIQKVMEAHLVSNISSYLPRVEALDLLPTPAHVGDEVVLSVRLAKGMVPESLETRFDQGRERLLMETDLTRLEATYRAEKSGRSRIDVLLVDRPTLLSPPLSVEFEVMP
jgi:hypothetical protein